MSGESLTIFSPSINISPLSTTYFGWPIRVFANVLLPDPFGPIITLFEIEPAEGVRVNKFTTLSEDLSRIMGGKRVRIIAPLPGSKSVGVELPNESPAIVYLKTIP